MHGLQGFTRRLEYTLPQEKAPSRGGRGRPRNPVGRQVARVYWKWRNVLGDVPLDRRSVGAYNMTSRKFPNLTRNQIAHYARQYKDEFADGQRLKGINRPR